jgi:hypothetical protein
MKCQELEAPKDPQCPVCGQIGEWGRNKHFRISASGQFCEVLSCRALTLQRQSEEASPFQAQYFEVCGYLKNPRKSTFARGTFGGCPPFAKGTFNGGKRCAAP